MASHLYLWPSTSSRIHSFPLKADRELSTPAEHGYRAAVLAARALNVMFLLTAYQAKLCNSYAHTWDQATWDKITSVADLFLSVQHSAVQAMGKVMANYVLQERAHWLNLTSLLDTPIIPEGIFGSVLTSMQERVEAKRRKHFV